jgi:hypothetical protein
MTVYNESKYVCKFLTINDIDQIDELIKSCSAKQQDSIPPNRNKKYYENLLSNSSEYLRYLMGAYKNDQLCALQECVFGRRATSWHLSLLIVRPGSIYFNCKTNGISDLYDFCFSFAESQGYYYYDWSQRVGKRYTNHFNRMKKQISVLQRYEHYHIGVIPANTVSKFSYYSIMNNNEIKSYDTLIRCGILKNEFRKDVLL